MQKYCKYLGKAKQQLHHQIPSLNCTFNKQKHTPKHSHTSPDYQWHNRKKPQLITVSLLAPAPEKSGSKPYTTCTRGPWNGKLAAEQVARMETIAAAAAWQHGHGKNESSELSEQREEAATAKSRAENGNYVNQHRRLFYCSPYLARVGPKCFCKRRAMASGVAMCDGGFSYRLLPCSGIIF